MKSNLDLIRMDWMLEQDQIETVEGKVPLFGRILYKLTHLDINLTRLGITVFLIVAAAITWRLTAIPDYDQSTGEVQAWSVSNEADSTRVIGLVHYDNIPPSAQWDCRAAKAYEDKRYVIRQVHSYDEARHLSIEIMQMEDYYLRDTKYEYDFIERISPGDAHIYLALYQNLKPGMVVEFEQSDYDLNSLGKTSSAIGNFLIPRIVQR